MNYLYNRGREWDTAYEGLFASIEERLGQLELHPLMPQPERLQHQIDRRKKESRCIKCGRKNHQASDCEYAWVSQTPPLKYTSNHNQEPVNKKARTDKGHLRITELGSEEDSGNK